MAQCARGRELGAPRAQLSTVPWVAHTQWSGSGFTVWAGFAKLLGDLLPGLCSSQRRRAPLRPRYRSPVHECAPHASTRLVAQPSFAALAASTARSQLSSAFGCCQRLRPPPLALRLLPEIRNERPASAARPRGLQRAPRHRPARRRQQQSLQRISAMSLSASRRGHHTARQPAPLCALALVCLMANTALRR